MQEQLDHSFNVSQEPSSVSSGTFSDIMFFESTIYFMKIKRGHYSHNDFNLYRKNKNSKI